MSGRLHIALVAAVLACAACGDPELGFAVAMRVDFDASISDAQLATVTTLLVASSGDENDTYTIAPGRPFQRNERFVYRPAATTRTLRLSIEAPDAQGDIVGSATTPVLTLEPGKTQDVSIIIVSTATLDMALPPPPDAAQKDGGLDLGEEDLSEDLALRPPSKCPTFLEESGAIRCRSYEMAADIVGPSTGTDGTVTIDSTNSYRGVSSLHTHVAGTQTTEDARVADYLGTTLPAFYAQRAFIYLPGAVPTNDALLAFQQTGSPYDSAAIGIRSDGTLYSQLIVAGSHQTALSTTKLAPGWNCLELDVARSTTVTGSLTVYLEDQVVTSLTLDGVTQETPDLTYAIWGLYFVSSSAPVDLWYDEVAIASSHIGCTQ